MTAHLVYVSSRRSYRRPREVTWWSGVAMAGLIFLLLVTGTALRYDQEGFEALAHFVAGVLFGLMALHFWLIRHLGILSERGETSDFRRHAARLASLGLLAFAVVGLLAVLVPEGSGYPPVAGMEMTKPMWPVLSFLLNFPWAFWQGPFYAGQPTRPADMPSSGALRGR